MASASRYTQLGVRFVTALGIVLRQHLGFPQVTAEQWTFRFLSIKKKHETASGEDGAAWHTGHFVVYWALRGRADVAAGKYRFTGAIELNDCRDFGLVVYRFSLWVTNPHGVKGFAGVYITSPANKGQEDMTTVSLESVEEPQRR